MHGVRRLAHVVEYFVLGLVVCVGLNRIGGDAWRSTMITPALCFVISLADQLIKWMLPTRHFDAFGIGCGGVYGSSGGRDGRCADYKDPKRI